jgi:hypothetical protein
MSRKVHQDSNYGVVKGEQVLNRIEKEIIRLHPKAEVTIEGLSEIAKGTIREWFPKRKFFSVEWTKLPPDFATHTDSDSELRVYFKVNLFTTQILFKSFTLRRLGPSEVAEGMQVYHYRIPEEIYQQQSRGALRIPLPKKAATLETPDGNYELIDLSVTGAKLRPLENAKTPAIGKEWKSPTLWFKKHQVSGDEFKAKVTRKSEDYFAVQFSKITDHERIQIKQFLIEALKTIYD